MNNRFKEVRLTEGLSQAEFGERIGITRDTVANIEGGRMKVKQLHINAVCKSFNINEIWLTTGEGQMRRQLTEDEELEEWIGRIQFEAISGDRIAKMKKRLLTALKRIEHNETWEDLYRVAEEIAARHSEE